MISILINIEVIQRKEREITDKTSARRILKKIHSPTVNLEKPIIVMDMKNKPEYYAGSKLTVYSKDLLIMIYTNAFYFEEALFNFYHVCRSFRNLLIKNYQIIDKNGVTLPIRQFDYSYSNYLLKSSSDRFRY
jgi:hypothetical protein